MKTAYRIGRDFNFHLYAVLLFNFWLFRQSLVSAAIGIHCTDVKGSEGGRFCPKRHSRQTFSLSRESVLTSMDGEEIGD